MYVCMYACIHACMYVYIYIIVTICILCTVTIYTYSIFVTILLLLLLLLFRSDYNLHKINFTINTTSNSRIFSTNFMTSKDFSTISTYFIYL